MKPKLIPAEANKVSAFDFRFFIGILVFIISCACGLSSSSDTPEVQTEKEPAVVAVIEETLETIHRQETQVALDQTQISIDQTKIAATATAAAQVAPTQEPKGEKKQATSQPNSDSEAGSDQIEKAFEENFSEDTGRFSTSVGITIQDGALFMGEFDQCAEFGTDKPAGCVSVCLACGDQLVEYEVNLITIFVDGVSERLYGLALRFIDENGDQYIDLEDYFLGWVFSVNQAKWYLYEHKPNQPSPWDRITSGDANLPVTPREPNFLRIVAYRDGQRIDIYMNDTMMLRIVSTPPMPGERFVEDLPNSGSIGFWVPDRGIRVKFDNFTFSDVPSEK
jgi:hypothetical protein